MCHGLKFQSAVILDGLIALFWGPMNGNRLDSHMLRESRFLHQLIKMMPLGDIDIFYIYGNPVYPQSMHIFGDFSNPI